MRTLRYAPIGPPVAPVRHFPELHLQGQFPCSPVSEGK